MVQKFPTVYEAVGSISALPKSGMMVHAYNSNTLKMETEAETVILGYLGFLFFVFVLFCETLSQKMKTTKINNCHVI